VSTDVPVVIVDRVTLPRTEAARWLRRMHDEYQPGAERRGYALEGVWQTRSGVPRAVEVVVTWRLPGVRAFFASRRASHDPATVAWWAATDAIAFSRSRSVMAPEAQIG
jgi:hypothetical protein